jgi:hypothetical protein
MNHGADDMLAYINQFYESAAPSWGQDRDLDSMLFTCKASPNEVASSELSKGTTHVWTT